MSPHPGRHQQSAKAASFGSNQDSSGLVSRVEARFSPKDDVVGRLDLFDDYVAWTGGFLGRNNPDLNENRIVVRHLPSKKTAAVATSKYPRGQTDWVRGSKQTVVYTDMAAVPSDEDPHVAWAIYAKDLIRGQTVSLAASEKEHDELYAPLPEIEWPWVVWGQAGPDESGLAQELVTYDLRNGVKNVVTAGSAIGVNLGTISINRGIIFFDADSPGGRDIFSVPADKPREPKRITFSGRVTGPVAANNAVVWSEPVQGDPESLWWQPLDRASEPVRFATSQPGSPPVGSPFPTENFVLWSDGDDKLLAADPLNLASTVELEGPRTSIPARWRGIGDRVTWAKTDFTTPPKEHATVFVGRLSRQ